MFKGFGKKKKPAAPPSKGGDALDKQIIALMEQLNIPKSGRDGILKLPEEQKKMMLEQYKTKLSSANTKNKVSGKEWSKKFNATKVDWKLLKEFEVVLKDSDSKFAEEFIQELGLKRLCRVSRENKNTQFDTQILAIFKAIIDTSQTIIRDIVNDDQSVTTIVSKVESDDNRVRELAIKLLVTLVIVEDDDLSLLASSKIMASLLDSARMRGYRNRWKSVLSHLSVNELSGGGSFEYDNYALMLINFIISGLETVEERTDERRLLNSLEFDAAISKLKKTIDTTMTAMEANTSSQPTSPSSSSNPSSPTPINPATGASLKRRQRRMSNHQFAMIQYQYCQSVTTQITAYNRLREEDIIELKKKGVIDDENDLSSPNGLFKVVHDQALDDGYINEFTSVLKNLMTIPASGDVVWANIEKIVQKACQPTQSKYKLKMGKNTGNNDDKTYLSFKELMHLLKVQEVEEEKKKEIEAKSNQTEQKLAEEQQKVNELEKQVQELQIQINTLQTTRLPPPVPSNNGLPRPVLDDDDDDNVLDKYRKMIKLKMPKQVIVNKMKIGGVSAAIRQKYELTGQLPPATDGGLPAPAPAPVPIAPAPAPAPVPDGLDKYRKMIKLKMPKQVIVNKMKIGGVSADIRQKYELTGQLPDGGVATAAPIPPGPGLPPPAPAPATTPAAGLSKEEEIKCAKYLRMKKMNLPTAAIRNKMKQDGINAALIDKFFGGSGGGGAKGPAKGGIATPKPKPKWPENLKRKAQIKPSKKMKNLQWTTVDPFTVEKSIWKECDDSRIKIDKNELEAMFGQKIVAKKTPKGGGGGGGGRKKKEAVEQIHILDGKRSYNIEIFLGRLRMKPFTCKDILLKMDEQKFNAEQVAKLQNFVPTPEEAQMFGELEAGDEKHLAKAEFFFYTIKSIDKNLPQRLELWAFKMNFDKLLAVESDKVYALRDAHKCIKTSKSLRDLFSTILAFGNYMNGGTKKGQAHGFKLNSLSQLTRSRSTDNKVTLMEYLYLYLQKKNPKLLSFTDEWRALESAVSVDVPTLRGAIAQIGVKLNHINNRCKAAATNSIAGDKFPSVMKPFYATASKKFETVKKDNEQIMKGLHELAIFLNEKNDRTGAFLKTLNEFRKQFIFTAKQCEEKKKREEEKKKREQWKLNKQKGKGGGSKKRPGGGLPKPVDENEGMDDHKDDSSKKPPPPPTTKRGKTLFDGNQNKSDQMLAAMMRSDPNALMNKLRARRKKNSAADK